MTSTKKEEVSQSNQLDSITEFVKTILSYRKALHPTSIPNILTTI